MATKATPLELLTRAADPDGRLTKAQADRLADALEELRDALDNAIDTARTLAEVLADSSTKDERGDAYESLQSDAESAVYELTQWRA